MTLGRTASYGPKIPAHVAVGPRHLRGPELLFQHYRLQVAGNLVIALH